MNALVITTSRADWNALGMVAKAMAERNVAIVVWSTLAGTSHESDLTIARDGFHAITATGMEAPAGLNDLFEHDAKGAFFWLPRAVDAMQPDLAILLGDRRETLLAAICVAAKGIPIAHLAGGDVSGGSSDEGWRHAITKIAHLHFPTHREAADRIIRMGEDPHRVHMLGSPSVDRILSTAVLSKEAALAAVGLTDQAGFILANWQPETPTDGDGLPALLEALDRINMPVVFAGANADPGGEEANDLIRIWCASRPNRIWRKNIEPTVYLSLMKHAVCLVGNSSSGFYEAPTFGTPVVNIGHRQDGRLLPKCVLSVPDPDADTIDKFIFGCERATGRRFPQCLYGDGHAAERIADKIISYDGAWASLIHKRFVD